MLASCAVSSSRVWTLRRRMRSPVCQLALGARKKKELSPITTGRGRRPRKRSVPSAGLSGPVSGADSFASSLDALSGLVGPDVDRWLAWTALVRSRIWFGELEEPAVLLILLLDRLPLLVGDDLALGVGAVLADHHEGREEDRLERDDHRQQPEGVVLDAEPDPAAEPDDVEVDERHRA